MTRPHKGEGGGEMIKLNNNGGMEPTVLDSKPQVNIEENENQSEEREALSVS